MDKEQIQELVEEVQEEIERGTDPHSALNEICGGYVNLNMTTEECMQFVRMYSDDKPGVFIEPPLDLTDDFDTIIQNMADNVLCREVQEKLRDE